MKTTRKLMILSFTLGVCVLVFWSTSAQAVKNNIYRAGYVVGYQEQELAKAADPTLNSYKYAVQKSKILKDRGEVPMNFLKGLEDGFEHSVRKIKPRYTIEKVDLESLPLHLHP